MGAVYQAKDTRLGISVAIKVLRPDPTADIGTLTQLRQQFKDEAQVVARLDHSNLVRVTDYFTWNSSECLVMNLVEGESLAERIERQGAQSETQVLAWAEQLLDALAYCHARDVVHRDVKPQNVIITPDATPVLVDFGLVKLWDTSDPRTRTAIRTMGTPEYAPPEQYSVLAGHTDPRSDLYSLGATLYHALTGQAPMSATDRMAMPEQFTPPSGLAPRVSAQTEAAVLRAMALPIAQRFSTAREMSKALMGKTKVLFDKHRGLSLRVVALGGAVLLTILLSCLIGSSAIIPRIRNPVATRVPNTHTPRVRENTPVSEQPTTTRRRFATTVAIHDPTSTPLRRTAVLASPTPDLQALSRELVERFQDARTTAYSTWDTGGYRAVLIDDALESAIQTVNQLRNMECRYYVSEDREMQFHYEQLSVDEVVVIASRWETQRRVCEGSTSYTCYAFDGRYVIERKDGQWYITEKSVQHLTETSPCP
jgi:serine/threonine-protein kinase